MIYGDVKRNDAVREPIAAGSLYLRSAYVPAPGAALARLAVLLDGKGGTGGQQAVQGVVYDAQGRLVAAGAPVSIVSGQERAVLELDLPAGLTLGVGTWWFGLFAGGANGVARFTAGPLDRSQVAAYSTGGIVPTKLGAQKLGVMQLGTTSSSSGLAAPPAVLDAPPADRPASSVPSVYLHAVPLYVPREMPDEDVVRLPFDLAQRILGTTAPAPNESYRATVGWHGVAVDDSGDATAIVRSDGPLAGLVGERVRVTRRVGALRRSVVVLVADEQPWPEDVPAEDLSVARRSWLRLGDWALSDLLCTVEVLS